jgi:ankyrin repeat protein
MDGEGTLAAVQTIVERGADVNGINSLGNSALHAAAAQEFPGLVKYLVEQGARVNLKNYKGQTPLEQTKIRDQVGRVVGELKTASVLKALGATDE